MIAVSVVARQRMNAEHFLRQNPYQNSALILDLDMDLDLDLALASKRLDTAADVHAPSMHDLLLPAPHGHV